MMTGKQDVRVRIRTLGQLRLERADMTELLQRYPNARLLLAALLSNPGRRMTREALVLLWPGLNPAARASRLDSAVYWLRRVLDPDRARPATSRMLLREPEAIMLADQSLLWVDADAFKQFLEQARVNSGEAEQFLEKAIQLYAGDFLPEETHPLVIQRRESLYQRWTGAMLDLAVFRIVRRDYASAIALLARVLMSDPANEIAQAHLAAVLGQAGKHGELRGRVRAFHRWPHKLVVPQCAYCAGRLLPVALGQVNFLGAADELLPLYRCEGCGSTYEFNYRLTGVIATPPGSQEQTLVHFCMQCGKLYPAGDPHDHQHQSGHD